MRNKLFGIVLLVLGICNSEIIYAQQNPLNDEIEFQWDFSSKRNFIYSFSQTVEGTNKTGKNGVVSNYLLSGNGYLNVRVKENNLADLSLTNLVVEMIVLDENGVPEMISSDEMPATVIQDMKPNGKFTYPNADIVYDILFPLPSINSKIGEITKIPMQVPFNASGSILVSKGNNELAFIGYETMEGRECAVLKGKVDVSNLEIPEELKGDYKNALSGLATYYFDLKNRYYVGADIQMLMEIMMDSKTEDENDFGMYAEMRSDYVIKIRLERIED